MYHDNNMVYKLQQDLYNEKNDRLRRFSLSAGVRTFMLGRYTMKKIHYAWVICMTCSLLFICNMGLCSNILTIYLPFIEAGGISHSAGSTILSVRSASAFLTTFIAGAYYRKLSLRGGIALATAIGACAPVVYAFAGSSALLYYFGALLAGVASGLGCIFPVAILLSNWFNTHKGLATGISTTGSGIATTIFSPLLSSVVTCFSLKTAFLVHAAVLFACTAAVFLLIRDTPAEKGLVPFGSGQREGGKTALRETPVELSPGFMAVLAVDFLLIGGVALSFFGHLAVLARSCGYSTEDAASMMTLCGVILIIGKMAAGAIADRIGTRRCSSIMSIIFIGGCLIPLCMNGKDVIWCYLLVIVLGFSASIFTVGRPLWAADLSSRTQYAAVMKWIQIFYNLGGIIFPMIPGYIAERTGEYKSSFILFAVMMVVALFLLLWAYRTQEKKAACA